MLEMAGNKQVSDVIRCETGTTIPARRRECAGLWLITRAGRPGHAWILSLRFELYVNSEDTALPEG